VAGVVQRHFLWDGASVLAELNGTGTAKEAEYSYYPGLDNPHALIVGTTQYFAHTDGLGNVIALTDTLKNVQRTYAYGPWGVLTGGTDYASFAGKDRARFKGALWLGPEAEVYYMRARWYEPKTGRFLSEDPIGLAGGINPYVFAASDPVNLRDPAGLENCYWVVEIEYYVRTREIKGVRVVDRYCESTGGGSGATGGVCEASTLAGPIQVDQSIAGQAVLFVNLAVTLGARIRVTSSFRTTVHQSVMHASWQAGFTNYQLVNPPNTSPHEAGFALDILWDPADSWSQRITELAGRAAGFTWRGPKDVVHFDWAGGYGPYRSRPEAIRANQQLAQPAVIYGGQGIPQCR
jgi:RHS repeat-associated protein